MEPADPLPARGNAQVPELDLNSRTDLIDDGHDPRTVFKLHPVLQDRDEITLGGYGRIEHMVTGSWLHLLKGALERLLVHTALLPILLFYIDH